MESEPDADAAASAEDTRAWIYRELGGLFDSVPDELRGRVMALYVTVFAGSTPVGGLIAGAVAQALGPPAGFLVGAGVATIFIGLAAWHLVVRGKGSVELPGRPVVSA